MATNSKTWSISFRNRLAAGALATTCTALTVVAIHLLAAYAAAGPIAQTAAQWAA